ncbi:acyl-ACP--UDP-N-acetylglucosamine O-acyltransferase [endosymbiont of Lamellibrachia barhami]|uniref:acyl-ACP--UDP-N-acetylglucosamine O-acyltransferase n=1 Tax=endosymbiont of Lamellibrachia barhami TaxID=205975 RepID=UPI0015AF4037|nr:acyl-ACP--UDP-N-acetylglucosamine O-acyltransferase [endosymbiont of Lamellibrachia barhami]
MSQIDQRAVIDSSAELGEGVSIGPFSVIGADVKIGRGTTIGPHVVINGPTRIGEDNRIFQFASVGEDPQDKKYGGEPTWLEIGDRNVIREFVTINRGTQQDAGTTRIGNDNLFMAYTHVAHDCQIGNDVIMANAASLGGHVQISDHTILGGFTIVHQFCRIGAYSFCAMGSVISKDLPPYVMVSGHPAKPYGINTEGLRRHQYSEQAIRQIKHAYKLLYKSQLRLEEAIESIREMAGEAPEVGIMVDFIAQGGRSILR